MLFKRGTVFTAIPRPAAEVVDRFKKLEVATIYEVMGSQRLMDPSIRPVIPGIRIAGCALTSLDMAGDNLMLHTIASYAAPGDILVSSSHAGHADIAMWGGNVSLSAIARGIAAVILDGGLRDADFIRNSGLPVWARCATPRSAGKAKVGWANVPIVCGGAEVCPGDIVVADDDGVVAVPRDEAEAIAEAAEEKQRSEEQELAPAMRAGKTLFELRGFQEVLDRGSAVVTQGTYLDARAPAHTP